MNKQLTILLIEDEYEIATLTKHLIKRDYSECTVVHKPSVSSAVEFLNTTNDAIDYIFLDLKMPQKNGFDFLNWYDLQRPGKPEYIYILTTSESPEEYQKIQQYDFVKDVIHKPLTPKILQKIVNKN